MRARSAILLASLCISAALSGCATSIVTNRPASYCSSLVPEEYLAGVAHDDFPPQTATVGDWITHAQNESDNLDISNRRLKTSVEIVAKCEAHDDALVNSLTKKPFLGLF